MAIDISFEESEPAEVLSDIRDTDARVFEHPRRIWLRGGALRDPLPQFRSARLCLYFPKSRLCVLIHIHYSFNLAALHGCSRLTGPLGDASAACQRGFLVGASARRQHRGSQYSAPAGAASTRGQSYLAIRSFFANHAKHRNHPPLPKPNALTLTQHSRSYAATATAAAPAPALTPEEEEWVANADILALAPSSGPGPRFDWRARAKTGPTTTTSTSTSTSTSTGAGARRVKRVMPPHVAAVPGEPFHAAIKAYSSKFLPLLRAEQDADEALLKERLASWPLARLREEGYCLTGLSAFWLDAPHFGRPVAAFALGPGRALPEHRFDTGTTVLVSRLDPLKEPPRSGAVLSHTLSQLRVAFPEKFALDGDEGDGTWRLDLGRSDVVYERMRAAVAHLNHDAAALARGDAGAGEGREVILQGTHLRGALLRTFDPASTAAHEDEKAEEQGGGAWKDDMRIMSWARRYARADPVRVEGDPVLAGLNPTQIRAAATMIGSPLSLVQGPPGTGKTQTLIATILLLKRHFGVAHPLLVCTYTNAAVDHLVAGLAAAGAAPVRVAFGGQAKSPHTLDAKTERHALKPGLDKLGEQGEALRAEMHALEKRIGAAAAKARGAGALEVRLGRMRAALRAKERVLYVVRAKAYGLRQTILRDILGEADVICTTCITAAANALSVIDFPVVFLDEASMSTEPASLIPIMKGHVALIGDHKQLPPIITSSEAQAGGLGISLFERLTEEGVVPSVMLDVQYRMHPAISRFPSSEFYHHSLHDGTIDAAGNIPARLLPPSSSSLEADAQGHRPSVVFLDHASAESMKDRSRVNHNEGSIVCSIVEDLLLQNPDLQGKDIGIIAPYAAQITLLTRMLTTHPAHRARFEASLGAARARQLAHVEVRTVDGFEGREKDVVVFSTVRCNAAGHIGFLADRRRLNVGLTRAKRALFVVGNMGTLKAARSGAGGAGVGRAGGEAWRRYAAFLEREGMVVRLTGQRLQRLLHGGAPPPVEAKGVAAPVKAWSGGFGPAAY
ncbi:hypothetical protein HWV62_24191 [Athelia sp. TMB]|nr:hypothetical protein HWV62_24191 [Athelia sp. TMB]